MNVAVLKTKAEQALAEAFSGVAAELPGGAAVRKVRTEAIGGSGPLGLPHRRVEAWKYTDLRNLMKEALPLAGRQAAPVTEADVDRGAGAARRRSTRTASSSSTAHYAPDAVGAGGRRRGDGRLAGDGARPTTRTAAELLHVGDRDDDAVLALNTAYASDGAVIDIAAKAKLEKPRVCSWRCVRAAIRSSSPRATSCASATAPRRRSSRPTWRRRHGGQGLPAQRGDQDCRSATARPSRT